MSRLDPEGVQPRLAYVSLPAGQQARRTRPQTYRMEQGFFITRTARGYDMRVQSTGEVMSSRYGGSNRLSFGVTVTAGNSTFNATYDFELKGNVLVGTGGGQSADGEVTAQVSLFCRRRPR